MKDVESNFHSYALHQIATLLCAFYGAVKNRFDLHIFLITHSNTHTHISILHFFSSQTFMAFEGLRLWATIMTPWLAAVDYILSPFTSFSINAESVVGPGYYIYTAQKSSN